MAIYWPLIILTISLAHNIGKNDAFSQIYDQPSLEDNEKIPDYTGAQVLKIRRCPELINLSFKNDFNVWSGNATHVDIMVLKKDAELLKAALSNHLIPYDVMIQDVNSLIQTQIHAIKLKNSSSERNVHRMSWNSYHRLAVIHEYMDYLANKYPSNVAVGVMGTTFEGRPIKYCKVTLSDSNVTGNAMFIEGGIHAREWISPSSVAYILKTLVENRNKVPDSLLNLEYYFVPVLNPDGYEYTFTADRLWRKNRSVNDGGCLGTDLNRNFDFQWAGKGSSLNPCSEIFRGKAAMSEAETKAVSDFIMDLKGKVKAYLTFHSYGQLILIPFGYDYNKLPPDFDELKRVGDMAKEKIFSIGGARYIVGNTAASLYPASGGSDDWAKGVAGVKYCFTVELRDTGFYAFLLPPQEIIATATDALEAFKVVASAVSKL